MDSKNHIAIDLVGNSGVVPSLIHQINSVHSEQMTASGVSLALASEAGLRSADAETIRVLLRREMPVGPGLLFPFYNPLTGEPLRADDGEPFVRVRLDDPSLAQDRNGKPCKYLTRRGAGQFPYITQRTAQAIREGAPEIILVEGEKKALSAVAQGLVAIGLTGNWGWKVKDKQTLLPLLKEFLPPGRSVIVAWDSDAALNCGFAASTRMLHDVLRRHGCSMKVVVLPQRGIHKIGLDDFLVANRAGAFQALVAATPALPLDRQVETDELLLAWCGALNSAFEGLTAQEAEGLLRASFAKGIIDQIAHATRLEILLRLQSSCPFNVEQAFRRVVEERLVAQYGPLADSAHELGPGDRIKLPDETRAFVVSTENRYLWVCRQRFKGRSWPVPAQGVEKFEALPQPAVLADEFLDLHFKRGEHLTLRCHRGVFYRWCGNAYAEIPDTDLSAEVMGFLRDWSNAAAMPKIRHAVVENIKAGGVCHVPAGVALPCRLEPGFPSSPNVISFTNGNLDVDALLHGDPDDAVWTAPTPLLFSLHGREFAFDDKATCPNWMKFLEEALPDEALRLLVQEIAGYCLVPNTAMQRFFLFYGPGANGKQVFTDVLAQLVGAESVCSVSLARFGERFSLWPLTTSLVNLVAELPATESGGARIAEDKLKAIVSGDFIEVERKNKDILKARPTARLIFSTNELPPIVDRSNGVWRRMIVVPFQTVIPEDRQDPNLGRNLIAEELPGTFNWALEGLLRLLRRGRFVEPEACRKLKDEHRLACISEEAFLREHVTTGRADEFVYVDDLYAAYRSYVTGGGGHPVSVKKFSPAVQRLFPSARKDRHALPERKRAAGFWGLTYRPNGITEEVTP